MTGWTSFNNNFTRFQSPRSGNNAMKLFGDGGVFQEFAASEGDQFAGAIFGLYPSFDAPTGGAFGALNMEFRDVGGNLIGDVLTHTGWRLSSPGG